MHSTNYTNTFIEVAEDCPVTAAETPPVRGDSVSIANLHHDTIAGAPYRHTSDDVIFHTHATRNGIPERDLEAQRERFFAKGRACLRASPLGKRYGWGIHHDAEGRVALVPLGTDEYRRLAADPDLTHVRAMRSKRA
jgi:hypothetical protein